MPDVSALTNGLMTLTGSTTMAKILVADKRIKKSEVIIPQEPVAAGNAALGAAGALPGGSKVGSLAKKAASATAKYAAGAITGAISNAAKQAGINTEDGDYNKSFTVQFNPSTLVLSGFSGGSYEIIDYSGEGKAAKATPLEPNISLSVRLIFDQVELSNSFPMDSVGFSISQASSALLKTITNVASSLNLSVQAVTEGFIGVLTNQYTQMICFEWGKLRYEGVLKSVNANYTMFDIMGRPVRSEVNLSLYLADKDIIQAGGVSNLGMWEEAYNAAFSDATMVGTTAADQIKKWSNIIEG